MQEKIENIVEGIIGSKPLAEDQLVSQGLDSLAAMELRQRVQVSPFTTNAQVDWSRKAQRIRLEIVCFDSNPMFNSHDYGRIVEPAFLSWHIHETPNGSRCKSQDFFGVELMSLLEDPASATIKSLAQEVHSNTTTTGIASKADQGPTRQSSIWISPAPVSIKMRIFCLPYAGGVSANVFARWVIWENIYLLTCHATLTLVHEHIFNLKDAL